MSTDISVVPIICRIYFTHREKKIGESSFALSSFLDILHALARSIPLGKSRVEICLSLTV